MFSIQHVSYYIMLHYKTTEKTALLFVTALEGHVSCLSSLCFSLHLLWALCIGTFKEIRCNPPLLPTPFPLTFSPLLSLHMNSTPTFFYLPLPPPHHRSSYHPSFFNPSDSTSSFPYLPYSCHFLPLSPPSIPLKLCQGIICPLSLCRETFEDTQQPVTHWNPTH